MTFLSENQLLDRPALSQRGRAGLELLGNIQDFSSGVARRAAREEFQRIPEAKSLAESTTGGGVRATKDRIKRAKTLAHSLPGYRYERFLQRYVAEEVYMSGIPAVEEKRAAFENLQIGSEAAAVGSLELDAEQREPRYYRGVDWHLEPGGYDGYDLYGDLFTHVLGPYVFKYGGYAAVGNREDITSHRLDVVSQLPRANYRRFYEPGCGGFSTLAAVHKVYPDADLVGSDISRLLLENGHRLAQRLNIPVAFKQRDARQTGESDESFDAVVAYALFHEMPPSVGAEVLQEMYRILEPGGDIVISDPPPFRAVDPFQAVLLDWDTKHRGEPFFTAVGLTNWCEVLKDIGFINIDEYALGPDFYPWVTRASKPV